MKLSPVVIMNGCVMFSEKTARYTYQYCITWAKAEQAHASNQSDMCDGYPNNHYSSRLTGHKMLFVDLLQKCTKQSQFPDRGFSAESVAVTRGPNLTKESTSARYPADSVPKNT